MNKNPKIKLNKIIAIMIYTLMMLFAYLHYNGMPDYIIKILIAIIATSSMILIAFLTIALWNNE